MNQPDNSTISGTLTGTAFVLLLQLSGTEVAKTVVLAILGAVVSFLVSRLLKKLQDFWNS